jgi:uncharacterized protein YdaU (DUF1376 family)
MMQEQVGTVVDLALNESGVERDLAPDSTPNQDATIPGGSALASGKSSKSPAFQFYPKDFLCDEEQQLLSIAEAGIYIRLICQCWLNGSLPPDLVALGRLCNASQAEIKRAWPNVSALFRLRPDGRWTHDRLDKERVAQRENSKKRKAAADARWGQSRNAHAVQVECPPSPSPTASPSPSPTAPQARTAGVMAGALPRDHVKHVWCGETLRVCVPETLHLDLRRKLGGDNPDARLKAFYAEGVRALDPSAPVASDVFKFWRGQFDARFAPAEAKPTIDRMAFLKKAQGAA